MDALDNVKALQLAVLESKLKTRFAFDFENSTLNQKARFSSFLRTVSEPVNADDGKHSFPEKCVCVNAGEIKRNGKGTDQFSQADLGLGCRQSFLSSLSKSWGSFPCLPCRCMANGSREVLDPGLESLGMLRENAFSALVEGGGRKVNPTSRGPLSHISLAFSFPL